MMEEHFAQHQFLPMGELPSREGMGRYLRKAILSIIVVMMVVSAALLSLRGYSHILATMISLLTTGLLWTLLRTRYVRKLYIDREKVKVIYFTATGKDVIASSDMNKVRFRYWLDISNIGMHKWVLVIRVGGKRFRLTESRSNSLMQRNTFSRQQLNEINNLLFKYLKEQ